MSSLFPRDPAAMPADAPRKWRELMVQGDYWINGQRIREMSDAHIENTMAMLLRDARRFAHNYFSSVYIMLYATNAPGEVWSCSENERNEAERGVEKWVKSTAVYKGLKRERKRRRKLAKWNAV